MRDDGFVFCCGLLFGFLLGFLIGGCESDLRFKNKLREGKGPALIEAIQLEDKASELRRQ